MLVQLAEYRHRIWVRLGLRTRRSKRRVGRAMAKRQDALSFVVLPQLTVQPRQMPQRAGRIDEVVGHPIAAHEFGVVPQQPPRTSSQRNLTTSRFPGEGESRE